MCCCRWVWALLAALLWSPAALADDGAARLWLLSVGAQADDDGSAGSGVAIDWAVTGTTWLTFFGGVNQSPDDRAAVTTRSLAAGFDQRIGGFGFTLGLESWGDPGEVESRDVTGSLYRQHDRYRFAVRGERRDIDVAFTISGPLGEDLRRSAALRADGLGASLGIALAERWYLTAEGMDYDYSRDLTLVPRLAAFDFLASSVLTLTNSFVASEWSIAVQYEPSDTAFTVRWREDRSAVDSSKLESLNVAAVLPLTARLDFELSLGISRADDLLGRGLYGGVYFYFYGGG